MSDKEREKRIREIIAQQAKENRQFRDKMRKKENEYNKAKYSNSYCCLAFILGLL